MATRCRPPLVVLAALPAALVVAGCGGGEDDKASDETSSSAPSSASSSASSTASSSPTPTESAPGSGATVDDLTDVLFQDHFNGKSTYWPTGKNKGFYDVAVAKGRLGVFVNGRGMEENNFVNLPHELDTPAESLAIDAVLDFDRAYAEGFGGQGIRCYAGNDYYMLYWGVVNTDEYDSKAYVVRYVEEKFEVMASEPQPAGVTSDDGSVSVTAGCVRNDDGSVTLSLSAGDTPAVAYTDQDPIGQFDKVSLFTDWKGEKVAPNEFSGANGSGLTVAWDDVVVRSG